MQRVNKAVHISATEKTGDCAANMMFPRRVFARCVDPWVGLDDCNYMWCVSEELQEHACILLSFVGGLFPFLFLCFGLGLKKSYFRNLSYLESKL